MPPRQSKRIFSKEKRRDDRDNLSPRLDENESVSDPSESGEDASSEDDTLQNLQGEEGR